LIDNREGHPYQFSEIWKAKEKKWSIPWKFEKLKTGDYTIDGKSDLITLERKSISDLFGTLSSGERRDRFREEHERMLHFHFAAVVIEASFDDIIKYESGLNPRSVIGTMESWMLKYSVHWILAGNRSNAEMIVFNILRKYNDGIT